MESDGRHQERRCGLNRMGSLEFRQDDFTGRLRWIEFGARIEWPGAKR